MPSPLSSLLADQLRDLFDAEQQLLKALPLMAKKAASESLRAAFTAHLEESREHIARLIQAARIINISPEGKTCKAMQGLIEDAKEVLSRDAESPVIDAALIIVASRMEHYEISTSISACAIAKQLGYLTIVSLLQSMLIQEHAADAKLTEIGASEVFPAAQQLAVLTAESPARAPKAAE